MRADEMDERIDAALRSYAQPPEMPESRVVLARVLERAHAERGPRRRWWAWAIPAAGCAAALLAAVVWVLRVPQMPEIAWTPQPPGVVRVQTAPVPVVARRSVIHRAAATRLQIVADALPKLETFPAPLPATAQEQKLVDFVERGPSAVKQQVVEARQHADDPLEIAELKIQPLDEGDTSAQPRGKEKP
jgi:hypothetical protein